MTRKIAILGSGKLAFALALVLRKSGLGQVRQFSRPDFDAAVPASIDPLLAGFQPDIVMNTVVFGGIDQCADDPAGALTVNALFPRHLAERASPSTFRLIHFSTEAVFANDTPESPSDETRIPAPPNLYGLTKYGADTLIPAHSGCYSIFRLPLLFGPNPKNSQFLEKMLRLGLAKGALRISRDIFSKPVYSMDVAECIVERGLDLPSGLYHLAGGELCSLYELTAEAARVLGLNIMIEPVAAATFPGKDIKNMHVALTSRTLPPLRSWRLALADYCRDWGGELLGKEGGSPLS